jgi:hypothetical protein
MSNVRQCSTCMKLRVFLIRHFHSMKSQAVHKYNKDWIIISRKLANKSKLPDKTHSQFTWRQQTYTSHHMIHKLIKIIISVYTIHSDGVISQLAPHKCYSIGSLVECRAITSKRPCDKQIYQSHYWVTVTNKHMSIPTNQHSTTETLLETVFSTVVCALSR